MLVGETLGGEFDELEVKRGVERSTMISDLIQAGSGRRGGSRFTRCETYYRRETKTDERVEAVEGQDERQARRGKGRRARARRQGQGPSAAIRLFRLPTQRSDTIGNWRYSSVERTSRALAKAGLDGHVIALTLFLPNGQVGLKVSCPLILRLRGLPLPRFAMHRTLEPGIWQRVIKTNRGP